MSKRATYRVYLINDTPEYVGRFNKTKVDKLIRDIRKNDEKENIMIIEEKDGADFPYYSSKIDRKINKPKRKFHVKK